MDFERIAVDPAVMCGKPCINGTRITVELIVAKLSGGATLHDMLSGFPRLKIDDINEAIRYNQAKPSAVNPKLNNTRRIQ